MADSCRPVSRHGRYNASGPSSVQYTSDTPDYGAADYTSPDETYTVHPPPKPERPKTSNGRRSRGDIPPRPSSRRSRQVVKPDREEESYGRPASRVGFSPENEYRYSHDEFSRQISLEGEKRIPNSPNNSPDPGGPFHQDQFYQQPSLGSSPAQRDMLRDSQQVGKVDRLLVSPSSPNPRNYRQSPQGYRESPKGYRQSPQGYRQSPQGYRQSPQGYNTQSPQFIRPSSRDNINVSPIHRDEAQISENDLHLHSSGLHGNGEMDIQEGDRYQQRFQESPIYGTSPYGTSPQYRDHPPYRESPQYGESPQYMYREGMHGGTSPPEQQSTYRRVLPSQRPKSARPKTGRKKSARVRHRHEEQETSQPQQCDTTSILNVGDPYGRPSSSLSPYKPLPAIGLVTPRNTTGAESGHSESIQSRIDTVTMDTQRLALHGNSPALHGDGPFHPADNDYDAFSAEDIQGARSNNRDIYTVGAEIPNVDMLTNLPQSLSEEIYKKSVLNFESQTSQGEDVQESDTMPVHAGGGMMDYENSGKAASDDENRIRSSEPNPLNALHVLPDEPSAHETRVLLAIKLLDGKRIQRYFRLDETLGTVLHFAENASLLDLNDYWLACNVPKVTFVDLSQSIADAHIQDRTVLYLEEKD